MIDGIGSLSMKRIVAFAMKPTWELPFCLVRRPLHLHQTMMDSVFKEFPKTYSRANENWGKPASEEVTKFVSVVFKETLSETALKNLLTKVTLSKDCKFAQAKLVNSVPFGFVYPSIRSADIKLKEVQHNMSKMTDYFIKLLLQLRNILKTNGDHKDEKL